LQAIFATDCIDYAIPTLCAKTVLYLDRQFGRDSQFGLEKRLQIFGLLPEETKTDPE